MQQAVDETLIRASQQGDRSAFAQLLALIYDMIFRFALSWSGCVVDAEDITQQVCIKLAHAIRKFEFKSAFSTWLYRLVVNSAHDWRRSQQRHSEHTQQNISSADNIVPVSAENVEAASELDKVLSILRDMGEGYHDTALLVYAEGLSHREAADVLGIKESTVSWRLHEIRKQLKQHERSSVEGTANGE